MTDTNKKEEFKSKLNTLTKEVKKAGKKVAQKTGELADIASVRIKLQGRSVKLSEAYEELGKLSYRKLTKDADNTEKISSCIEKIDGLLLEISNRKSELAEKMKKSNDNND